ncbi:hypothetical protein AO361_04195 [Pseudomonas fluorescens]|uniref:hypothetical protein n=1 Tax=Pseudomonas TaxID=286 RepID=UPI0009A13C2C|nr:MULTISPECIES: hypothetical protein [Pseudomonas]OOQ42403.1 hypothetical protein AO361_04195 [Pseudomonas fluorescens]
MKISKSLIAVFALTAFHISSAAAGPSVTVTFKNLGTQTATYTPITNNEAITKANASPTPQASVIANDSDTYVIQSQISPDYNHANLRYQIGNKKCIYLATFVTTPGFGASKIPKWNNTATPSGGATCTIKVTNTNPSTYAWSVVLTMK